VGGLKIEHKAVLNMELKNQKVKNNLLKLYEFFNFNELITKSY